MSRAIDVLRQKNKREKQDKERIKLSIQELNKKTYFRGKLQSELRRLDILLDQEGVKSVIISIPDKSIALFTEAVYEGETSEFEIKQLPGSSNEFEVSKAYIEV